MEPEPKAYKVVFLIGDASPHMAYQDDVKYHATIAAAGQKGIVVNAIQCGASVPTAQEWQKIAKLGKGRYFQVEQEGSAVAIATPFDEKLAELSKELDDTRLYYGNAEEKDKRQQKMGAADKLHKASSVESRARRAAFNASQSGEANFLGKGELVADLASGRVHLESIAQEQLPDPMQAMAPEEQKALITETSKRRNELQREIKEMAQIRSDFLKKKVAEQGGAKDSLDRKVHSAIGEQAGKQGLRSKADALDY